MNNTLTQSPVEVGLALGRHPCYVGAAWLFVLQVALSGVPRVASSVLFPARPGRGHDA